MNTKAIEKQGILAEIYEDIKKTSEITWLKETEVSRLLQNYTHSELRLWHFVPWKFTKVIDLKRENKTKNIII